MRTSGSSFLGPVVPVVPVVPVAPVAPGSLLFFAALGCLVFSVGLFAAPSALIIGRVVDQADRPLAGTVVTLKGAGPDARVLVDSKGRFVFRNVPAGAVTLTAVHDGYVSGEFGKTRFDGRGKSLDLTDGQRVTDLQIKLWRHGSFSGRVVDDAGEPIAGALLWIFNRRFAAGRWLRTGLTNVVTDDRGVYSSGLVPPGNYSVAFQFHSVTYPTAFAGALAQAKLSGATAESRLAAELTAKGAVRLGVSPDLPTYRVDDFLFVTQSRASVAGIHDGGISVYPQTFYPGALDPSGSSGFDLAAGETRTGLDLSAKAVATSRVSGVVVGPDGPISNLGLRLHFAAADEFSAQSVLEVADTTTASNGEFTFLGVPPGSYVIWAVTSPVAGPPVGGGDPGLWGRTPVTVSSADVRDLRMTMRARVPITGQVVFEGMTAPPPAARLTTLPILVEPESGRTTGPAGIISAGRVAAVDAQGRFTTNGLLPGRYFLRVSAPPAGWTLKSVVVKGRNAPVTAPIEVGSDPLAEVVMTFTDQPTMVTGAVRDATAGASPVVLMFPADRGAWADYGTTPSTLRSVRPGSNSLYAISGVPSGDYFIIALDDVTMPEAWQEPSFLDKLARIAKRITVDRSVGVDLTVTAVR